MTAARAGDALLQGKAGMSMYRELEEGRSQGDFSILPEVHATLSGLKVPSPRPTQHARRLRATALSGSISLLKLVYPLLLCRSCTSW